jgi:sec-independent protein translocase protein TatC
VSLVRRGRKTQFQQAADGSMSLLDHLRELRGRLFKAALGIVAGMIVGWLLSKPVMALLQAPYCNATASQREANAPCQFVALGVTDQFGLALKVALIVGLIVSAPVWLYQLWAFIAPGLHKHERRWAYLFAGLAAPLFALGSWLAYIMLPRALDFLLSFGTANVKFTLDVTRYMSFVSNLILLFGIAFEFPLIVMLFNIAGLASGRRLLGWWRGAVFAFFAFAAVAIPTGDPFSMTALGLGLTALYFAAVGFAFINDKRRARRERAQFGDVDDDVASPIAFGDDEALGASPLDQVEPVEAPRALDHRYDDVT